MPLSIFLSRLGITDLVNKIKIYTNLIKLFHFETYILIVIFETELIVVVVILHSYFFE